MPEDSHKNEMKEPATTDDGASLVAELIDAANEIERASSPERANLIRRAASTISDYHIEIAFSMTPANEGGPDDVVHELNELVRLIDQVADDEVVSAMLNAAELIADRRTILQSKEPTGDPGAQSAKHDA